MEEYLTTHWRHESHVLIQAVVALTLGGLLGWERQTAGKWAGFRTHMFVCLASMLFVRLGQLLIADSAAHVSPVAIRADPVHIIAAIATGVSFLGAGTIFRDPDRETARGLTTAASLLATASIGVSVAIDRYLIALGVTLLSLFVLHTLRKLENVVKPGKA
jgi:putative Mg2+ transporter-C (MgtC) family protein